MTPTDSMPPNEPQPPISPQPIVGNQPAHTIAAPTAKKMSTPGKWLPRLIIAAILVNILPSLGPLAFGEDTRSLFDTIRNYGVAGLFVGMIILIIHTVGAKNAKN